MGSESSVVEISSDDEEDFSLDNLDSLDWVADLLDLTSGRVDEADDVMVVDEFSSAPPVKQKKNYESLRPAGGSAGDESDDDCLVLESNPDKPVSSVDKGDGGDESDDVLIVGEKGQQEEEEVVVKELACRDYPHPRHLCLNFPFSTTSHEKHCNLCHCYVCDSPAPCIYWGNGSASTNHCHSTDKDGKWKALRQSFKQKKITTSQKPPDVALSMMPSFQNPAPLSHSKTSLLSIPSFRSSVFRPCTATRCAASNPPNQRHQQNLAPLSYHGQRLSHHPSKSHPLNPRTQYAHRRIHAGGTFTARLVHSHTKFKRVGTTQVGPVILNENRSACSVSNNNQFQGNVLRRSHFTTITSQRSQRPSATSQRSQCPPVTSQRQRPPLSPSQRSCSTPVTSQVSQCTPGTSVEDGSNQIYRTAPVTSQSSQCLPMTPANDNMKSWQDMLARVASELGVFDSNSRDSAPTVEQPVMVSSQPLPFSQFDSETNVSQDVDFYGPSLPEVTNLNSLDFDCGWSNPAAQSIQKNGQGVDPQPKNVQPSDLLVSGSKMDPGETQMDSFLCSTGKLVAETPKDTELPELDPVTLLCDLAWSDLEPV